MSEQAKAVITTLSFERLRATNTLREASESERIWKNCPSWTLSDWTNALAGEVGEACNITKKMSLMYPASGDLHELLAKELADVVLYADLIASKIGKTLPEIIIAKFNEVSNRIGSDIRL